jgi:hypothetical protein
MPHVFLLVAAQSPPPADTVGPGVGGFLAIFALAVATVFLIRSMVGHLRKVRYGPGPEGEDVPETDVAADPRTDRTPPPGG